MRSLFRGITVAALVACLTIPAIAAIETGQKVSLDRSSIASVSADGEIDVYTPGNSIETYGSGPGGEFRITTPPNSGNSATEQFQTFCIEKNEYVVLSGEYYVTLNNRAIRGGVGQGATYMGDVAGNQASSGSYTYTGQNNTSGDPVSEATKWLYNTYLNSDLDEVVSGYDYDSNSKANALQDALWFLENEQSWGSLGTLAKAIAQAAISAVTASDYARVGYDVLVMNLWTNKSGNVYSGLAQSQLYRVSTTGTEEVPEPSTILVWGGLAAIGCVAVRRRRQSQGTK